MADYYGNQLVSANDAPAEIIEEAEETLYGGEESNNMSQNQSVALNDHISTINAKKNMNFDPDSIAKHRKNMSSRDALMTPTSGITETEDAGMDKEPINNFRPLYPGKRNSVAPEPIQAKAPQHHMSVIEPISAPIGRDSQISGIGVKSVMIDRSQMEQSLHQQEKRQLTEECDNESLGDEPEIIPEDERWKTRKCFWQMNEQIRIRWDLFVMILATWN
jgi:hypothetical protein